MFKVERFQGLPHFHYFPEVELLTTLPLSGVTLVVGISRGLGSPAVLISIAEF